MHVAEGYFHDMDPAHALGIPRVWINRQGLPDDPSITDAVLPERHASTAAEPLRCKISRMRRIGPVDAARPPVTPGQSRPVAFVHPHCVYDDRRRPAAGR